MHMQPHFPLCTGMYVLDQLEDVVLWCHPMGQLLVDYAMAVCCTGFLLLYPMVPGPITVLGLVNLIVYSIAYFMR